MTRLGVFRRNELDNFLRPKTSAELVYALPVTAVPPDEEPSSTWP